MAAGEFRSFVFEIRGGPSRRPHHATTSTEGDDGPSVPQPGIDIARCAPRCSRRSAAGSRRDSPRRYDRGSTSRNSGSAAGTSRPAAPRPSHRSAPTARPSPAAGAMMPMMLASGGVCAREIVALRFERTAGSPLAVAASVAAIRRRLVRRPPIASVGAPPTARYRKARRAPSGPPAPCRMAVAWTVRRRDRSRRPAR